MPPLAVLAYALFAVHVSLSNAHTHHESHACRWIPLPWTIWATSYGGLLAALGAVVLWIALWRWARARGRDPGATWQGRLAGGFAMVGGLAVLVLAGAVVLTHLESAEIAARPGPMCEGLGRGPYQAFMSALSGTPADLTTDFDRTGDGQTLMAARNTEAANGGEG
ncbi:hypothetical protein FH608_010295 [Nonomuraea phyllanthi]|uniref:Uncharacterized protein n=1 Tax=Nonomuraea phyllanthi TaxID=2219224 RepID=A0A5C4WT20_9ACTN|nr:hypothetical protein [Nonomuraea phyllanthi]KAB8195874.1 hypothetical protein FH608_010295 [Nonomuraea phyllanthi]